MLAETAGAERFSSDAKLARLAGVAPIPASSGKRTRHRLDRGGNRQLNCALHRIAVTQGRVHPPAREFLARKQAEGKSRMEVAMNHEPNKLRPLEVEVTDTAAVPVAVERATFQAELDALRVREKAHTSEGDAIAAARRRLPMVEMDPNLALIGPRGPVTLLDAFEGRPQLIAYYFMWHPGRPAAEQCEGCTFYTTQVGELSQLHSRGVTYATFCQGPYEESVRYREFMGWEMPWYSAQDSLDSLLIGRQVGKFHLVCYLRCGDRVFETYWTNGRGVEAMDYSYALLDLAVYGRQETWEDSPVGWPQTPVMSNLRTDGRPTAQWSRVEAGRSDDLQGTGA